MLRIPSISTPVSPLSSVVSSPYKSALTHANNSLANASGVTHQRQGAKIGTGNFREDMYNVDRLFQFIGAGLPFLTSEGQFDIQDVIKVARQYAKTRENNPTVSQIWKAIAQLIDPSNHPDVTVNIHPNLEEPYGIIMHLKHRDSNFFSNRDYSKYVIPRNFFGTNAGCILPRGVERTEHLKGLNGFLAFLEDYQAYINSLKTESPLSQ